MNVWRRVLAIVVGIGLLAECAGVTYDLATNYIPLRQFFGGESQFDPSQYAAPGPVEAILPLIVPPLLLGWVIWVFRGSVMASLSGLVLLIVVLTLSLVPFLGQLSLA